MDQPRAPIVDPSNIPEDLKTYNQWVAWRYELNRKSNKWTKVPYNANTGKRASSVDPKTWASFYNAFLFYNTSHLDGIGFVLSSTDNFVAVDIDHCINKGSVIDDRASEIIKNVNSYTEISPSGEGIRILVRGKLPPGARKKEGIEIYDTGRYVTITGSHLKSSPIDILERQLEIDIIHAAIFNSDSEQEPVDLNDSHATGLLDKEVLQRVLSDKNGPKFWRLWTGDISEYPSQSEADLAICSYLAFYSGDPDQVDRIYRQSALYREKWDEVHGPDTYGNITLETIFSKRRDFYHRKGELK